MRNSENPTQNSLDIPADTEDVPDVSNSRQVTALQNIGSNKAISTSSRFVKVPRWMLFSLLVMANLIWSGSFAATSVAARALSPTFLTMIRLLIGGIVLFPFVIRMLLKDRTSLTILAVLKSALLGIIGFTLPVTLETLGIHVSSPALGAVSIALEPLFTVLISSLLLRQHLQKRRRLAMGLAALGAWVVAGCPRPGVIGYAWGDILLLCAVLCYALYNAISSRLTENVSPAAATSIMLLAGSLGCVPLWLFNGHLMVQHLSMSSLVSLLYLSLFATSGAYLIWLVVLQDRDIASATITLYLQPVFGVLFSIAIVHVWPNWFFYAGAVVILLALYLGSDLSRSPFAKMMWWDRMKEG